MGDAIYRYETVPFSPLGGARSYEYYQLGNKEDFHTPTAYTMYRCYATDTTNSWWGGPFRIIDAPNSTSIHRFFASGGTPWWSQPAANAAYEDFRDRALGSTSSLGAAFAEWQQSLGMITQRAIQLAQSARALRRRDFPALYRAWKDRPHPRRSRNRERARKASSLWLEYSFGWKPLLGDIDSAMEQMCEPFPSSHETGHARSSYTKTIDNMPGGWSQESSVISHWTGGYVVLTNPNLFLYSQLGLINPLSIAWELIPGSFVADWLFDVSSFLGSFADFAGCSVERSWQSHKCEYSDLAYSMFGTTTCRGWGVGFLRGHSLIRPFPNRQVQANLGTSLSRALNATALATQAFLSLTR